MFDRDVFISHAFVDKTIYARPLNDALNARGISCWLDEAQILPGDSIVEKVNDGLASSRLTLVIITDEFLARNWPQKELNAALSREIRENETLVIPVLCTNIEKYFRRYPLLSDKFFLDWREGVDSIADRISALFPRFPELEWYCSHPMEYVGLVWVRLVPGASNVHVKHTLTLRWGPYFKTVEVVPESSTPLSFVHHKTNRDSIVLHAQVYPASIITFGRGPAPDSMSFNIDEGWTRSAGGSWPGHL